MALIFWASRRKNKKDIVRHDVLPNSAEPLANDQGQLKLSISCRVTTDSYLHDPEDDTHLETPHPNINSWNDRKSAVLQIYKHDYDYPSDYRIYGLDAQSWWRSIKPKG
jgi:hypothetical protein